MKGGKGTKARGLNRVTLLFIADLRPCFWGTSTPIWKNTVSTTVSFHRCRNPGYAYAYALGWLGISGDFGYMVTQ